MRSSNRRHRRGHRLRLFASVAALALLGAALVGCSSDDDSSGSGNLQEVAKERGLSDADLLAAAKTYTPSGTQDEYLTFASGGQSGQVHVIGVPSMRLLRTIGVFTPEPWQGWGYGSKSTDEVIEAGTPPGTEPLKWADTHHPALSETDGDYDGEFLFINDKANSRVATIDLRDFETVLRASLTPVIADLHIVAGYVVAADMAVSRGGSTALDTSGSKRSFHLRIPVTDPGRWFAVREVRDDPEIGS